MSEIKIYRKGLRGIKSYKSCLKENIERRKRVTKINRASVISGTTLSDLIQLIGVLEGGETHTKICFIKMAENKII